MSAASLEALIEAGEIAGVLLFGDTEPNERERELIRQAWEAGIEVGRSLAPAEHEQGHR